MPLASCTMAGLKPTARQEAMNSLDLAPYPAGCGLAGKCPMTVLVISDQVRENSRAARHPGSNREFSG